MGASFAILKSAQARNERLALVRVAVCAVQKAGEACEAVVLQAWCCLPTTSMVGLLQPGGFRQQQRLWLGHVGPRDTPHCQLIPTCHLLSGALQGRCSLRKPREPLPTAAILPE